MDNLEALQKLAGWLLAQNSVAARLLSRYPHLISRLSGDLPLGRTEEPRPLPNPFDEEEALADLRLWLAEGQLSIILASAFGRLEPQTLAGRWKSLAAGALDRALLIADRALRERYHHPLLLPEEAGPGPLAVLAWSSLAAGEANFDQPLGLLFLFSRRQPYGPLLSEDRFERARIGDKGMIILKEYVLKVAQKVIGYLTLDHPNGPGLKPAIPEGLNLPLIGPQINSLARFIDFFTHSANDSQKLSLARVAPLAGHPKLARDAARLSRRILLEKPWDRDRLEEAIDGLRRDPEEGFSVLDCPGGLRELGFLLDGLLLSKGVYPSGSNPVRVKRLGELGVLDPGAAKELNQASRTLLLAHLASSFIDRDLSDPNDLEAALALWPSRAGRGALTLAQSRQVVQEEVKKLLV